MDGFYVAKLKKLENGPRVNKESTANDNLNVNEEKEFVEQEELTLLKKGTKLSMKAGAQGVVEVTANGEDFDWDDAKKEEIAAITDKKTIL